MTRSRSRRLAAATLAAALTIAACGSDDSSSSGASSSSSSAGSTASSAAPTGRTASIPVAASFDETAEFIWAHSYGATSWDPVLSTTGGDRDWLIPIYDRLLYSDELGNLEPMLAESWEGSADGLSVTLKLRQGVTFHDGTPFNAEAVKFNLDRAKGDSSKIKNELAAMASVTVDDEHTVTITVTKELGAFLSGLANKPGMMVSPTAAQAGTLEATPIGAGPYTVSNIVAGDSATFNRYEGYWDDDAQRVAKMVFRVMADENVRYNALKDGQVHGAPLNPAQVAEAEKAGLQVIVGESPVFTYLAVNNGAAPFDDVRVRKAISLAIDREGIGEGLYDGFCKAQVQPWPSTSFAYSDKIGSGLDKFPYDVAEAKKLLADAGYPDGFTSVLMSTNITGYVRLSEVVQSQLADIGIKVELKPVPPAQFIEEFSTNKTVPMVVNGYPGAPDPDDVMKRLINPGTVVNPGGQLEADMIALGSEAATSLDPADRAPVYEKLMGRFIEEPIHLMPICMQQSVGAFVKGVSGVSIYTNGARDLRGVAVSK